MDYVRMGQILRERREEYCLTQKRLAEFVGISPVLYGRIERGEHRVDLETLVRLAEALGLSLDLLVDRKGRQLFL